MSARSPRGSLSGASSEEVADDFGESLKDLQINNRYEISNLTLIAKESTEHAQAISRVLENHIKTTAPSRKLPALYLLDSIVKNVGTPYTVYLAKNLYSTFMNAYTQVDNTTRRSMEGMLKTWREPVPGALDTKPVFDPELVRPIETALIKARTAALQSGRQGQTQAQVPYRSTPTPPQYNNGNVGHPPSQGQAQSYYGYGVHQPTPLHQNVSAFSPTPQQHHPQQNHPYASSESRPVSELESIKRDLAALITQRQGQLAASPYNQDLQHLTRTLSDLQAYLNSPKSQELNSASLQQIRDRITDLARQGLPQPKPTPPPSLPTQSPWQPPATNNPPRPPHLSGPPVPYSQPQSAQPQPQAPFLNPSALNGLQTLLTSGQKPGTPQMRQAAPELQNASHTQLSNVQTQAASLPNLNSTDLLAALSKNGLLPPANPTPAPPPPTTQSTASLLQSLQSILPPLPSQTTNPKTPPTGRPRVPISQQNLKTFRPELLDPLYTSRTNQCTTCGRRFPSDPHGRTLKARHLDWHFRTNQRLSDTTILRGAHRDWYVDERPWIQTSEFDPSTADPTAATAHEKKDAAEGKKTAKEKWVRAPPGVTRNVCEIDFEEMRARWSDEVQEWVFMNAVVVGGGRIVHASCLEEMARSRRSATPETSLGKRKAGVDGVKGGGRRVRVE